MVALFKPRAHVIKIVQAGETVNVQSCEALHKSIKKSPNPRVAETTYAILLAGKTTQLL